MLWIDMQISRQEMDAIRVFEEHFELVRYDPISSIDKEIEEVAPRVICFDFDFPTKPGLKELQRIKKTHPRIPLLMLTVQHSESLAVWAFRSRVWDYFVKPIAASELDYCLAGLLEMLEMQALQPDGRRQANVISLIPDENRSSGPRGSSPMALAPAVTYVESGFRDKVSSSEAAEKCGLTSFQFSRLFRETYGFTFQDYVNRYRIREACRLLRNPAAEVSEVSHLVGFNDVSYFGKIFKRYMHCSPSQFSTTNESALDASRLSEDLELEARRRGHKN